MPLSALRDARDRSSFLFASCAEKGKDYFCRECQGILRVRKGEQRLAHFYHLHASHHCALGGKSEEHLHAQLLLQRALNPEHAHIEESFDSIGRIADIAYFPQKIVFEIQCSPISCNELRARNRDYASAGWKVVWILHEARFSPRSLSPVQCALQKETRYYTNIDRQGKGIIYDQCNLYRKKRRIWSSPRLPLQLNALDPQLFSPSLKKRHPLFFLSSRKITCKGDLIDLALLQKTPLSWIASIPRTARISTPQILKNSALFLLKWPFRCYMIAFRWLLEKSTD